MGRSPCCSKEGLNRGAWTALEDKILTSYIKAHGEGKWRNLPKRAGLKRCGKSCRLRWLNYLRPDIKRGNISHDEEELIVRLHKLLGNRWSLIAGRLPGRTDNEIKNYWNTTLGKKAGAQQTESSSPQSNPSPITKSRVRKRASTANPKTYNPPVAAIQAQAIRTKAFKCTTKIFVPTTLPPLTDNYPVNSTPIISLEPQTQMINSCDLDNLKMEFGAENPRGISNLDNFGGDENQASDDDANPLPFDQTMFEDWATVTYLEDNANLDLGCLSFLLDSEEWP